MAASPWQRATILMEVLNVTAQMDMEEVAEQTELGVQVLTLSFYYMVWLISCWKLCRSFKLRF